MILMKYHALFVILKKSNKIWNCRLLQIIGGALGVKVNLVVINSLHAGKIFSLICCLLTVSSTEP